MFLDFLDEPLDSIRRKREGTFASYQFGSGNRKVKVCNFSIAVSTFASVEGSPRQPISSLY